LARDDYAGGVWFVPLGSLDDPGLVLPTIATVLGIPDPEDPVAGLGERVAGAATLLVVDTVEQVIGASVDLARLSRAVPALSILATSREPMRIEGERLLDLPPMGLEDASALFAERARASGRIMATDDPRLRELCRRLDGLPLAVELVAARSRVLDLRQLSRRLDDRLDLAGRRDADPRHQTLRATIAWSHDLLDEGEQSAFARLSVFAGEWDLDAAEQVCGADSEIVIGLADRSLIRTHQADEGRPGRFSLLDTIRVFAAEQLEARDERPRVTERLDGHLVDTAVARAPRLKENDQLDAFAWFDMAVDDLRAAVARLLEASDPRAAGLVLALVEYLWRRGLVREEDALIEAALLRDPGEIERGRLLRSRGMSMLDRGDAIAAERDLVEARSIAFAVGQPVDAASASYTLAYALLAQDRHDEARALFDEVASSSGDARLVALCHWGLGGMAKDVGDLDLALEELDTARRFHRSIEDRLGVAWIGALMGQVLVDRGSIGDPSLACATLGEAFETYARLGASPGLLDALTALGFLALPTAPDIADEAARWGRRILDRGYAPEIQDVLGIERLERAVAAAGIPPGTIPEGYGIEAATWARRALERIAS
jgi:predicted ATPase